MAVKSDLRKPSPTSLASGTSTKNEGLDPDDEEGYDEIKAR